MRGWIGEKTAQLLSILGGHVSWELSNGYLWVVAEDVCGAGLSVCCKLCDKMVIMKFGTSPSKTKLTIDEVHESIKKQWERSGV